MATESLIVELDARTQKLDAALKSTDDKLNKLDSTVNKTDKSFGSLSKVADVVSSTLKTAAVASVALATALTAMTLKSAESEQQLAILSRQAKLSTGDFEALAFATKQYGIDAEQIADISKDLSDKLGEFGKAGTGAFQDYADVIGLTKEEAKAAAIEFENMSSDQVIGAMVSNLEKAGASANEVTFVLESMGNDLSRLAPLFANNASELERLTGVYKQATEQLSLTGDEIQALQGAATSFDLMTDALSKGGSLISSQIAPLLNDFFTSVIETVPEATQTIVDFINSFKAPEEISNIASVQSQIAESEQELAALTAEKQRLSEDFYSKDLENKQASAFEQDLINRETDKYNEKLRLINERIIEQGQLTDDLKSRELELVEQREADESESPAISAAGGDGGSGTGDEVQAIADRFKTEEELLTEKLERELELIGENNELKLELQREFDESIAELRQADVENAIAMNEELSKSYEKNKKDEKKANEKTAKDKRTTDEQYISIASNLNTALFNDNKAIKAAIVVADTASAIMKSLSINPYDYLNVGVIAANGAAQLATITSSSPGDSSTTSPTTGGATSEIPEPDSELFVSDTDVSGASNSQVITIKVESDDSELAVALNGIMSKCKNKRGYIVIAATSNIAPEATVTATPDTSLQEISVITDGDYSSVYTDSLSNEVDIEFTFATPMDVGYIAIGGSNIAKKDSITITATTSTDLFGSEGLQLTGSDGLSLVAGLAGIFDDSQLGLNESPVIMYKVDFKGATSIIINVKGGGQISIAEVAMGDYYEIPRGEQSGFKRPWSVPNIQARSSVGLDNAPVNLSYESRSLKCTLSVPNNIMVDFEGWYNFINYAASNTFYILEDENKFHSYACFNAVPDMTKSHSKTKSLGVSSIKFNAFAKSTEALF